MSRNRMLLGCLLAIVTAAGVAMADHHEGKAKAAANESKPAADQANAAVDPMAEMMKAAAPGQAHKNLEAMVGTWKAVVKNSFMAGQEPTEGIAENKMIMGGRYLEMRFKGTMVGQPFEGYGLTGYDNTKKTYTSFWIDNMSTAWMSGAGSMDDKNKTITFISMGEGTDGKPAEYRTTTTMVDANKHVFTMHMKQGDQEMQVMEITYTRM